VLNNLRHFVTRWLVPLIGSGLALSAVFFLYRSLNVNLFLGEVQKANLWWIAVLAATIVMEQFVQGWKWRQLLYDIKPISAARLTGAFIAGYGVNILVPLGVSPFVRSWLVARLEDLNIATVLMTTAISRFIDGIVFAIFAGVVAIAGQLPRVEGNLTIGLGIAGAANLIIFVGILWLLFRHHGRFLNEAGLIGRLIDWIAEKAGSKHGDVRAALAQGIIWPRERMRQQGVIAASFAMKAVSATHYLWAGLALGITLNFFDYLFLMVFAGFALVLSRFIRVPGGFLIGSGFALKLLDVPDEQALAMILFNHIISVVLMVVIGLIVFWQSGIDMRAITRGTEKRDVRG
jgi:uncharacterized membrane protein YbhN (UPF0104 family)